MRTTPTFRISGKLIWLSSIFLGILAAIPKIADQDFEWIRVIVDACVTASFSVIIWYYNIRTLPAYAGKEGFKGFLTPRLFKGIGVGLAVMLVLAGIQQYLVPYPNYGAVILMFEVRGILINMTFYLFTQLLYQNYLNQQVNIELERSTSANIWAQYELLRQQVNPHFLFNGLNTLKYMVETGDEQAVNFILKLSDFYRFTLENRKHDLIRLSEEMEIVHAYMYLLKARFEEGISIAVTIDEKVYDSLIPPFTLQLLIENCIKHNVVSIDKPLHITINSEGDTLVVSNRIQVKRIRESSTGLGLENIRQRYNHLLNRSVTIVADEENFTIKLPVVYENHYH
ncbi:sensor histidine kinase [Sinomicrobium sp. M5D2P17]